MNRYFIIFIFVLLFSITAIAAEDSSNWEKVSISGNEFRIPPEYGGGSLSDGKYQINNWNTFAILCVDNYLANNYGYVYSSCSYSEMLTIEGHPAYYFCGYNSYEKTNLSRIYFACGESIYCISYKGSNLSSNINEIVATSPASSISSSDFYSILDEALDEYNYQKELDENTYYQQQSYSSNDHYNKGSSFVKDYFFFKMGQYSSR